VFRSTRVATPDGIRPASIHIAGERIAAVLPHDDITPDAELIDAGDALIFPGLVDTHVHLNEPGRTEWEGFASGTDAAAAGGVTTLVDMPLNSIPATTSVTGLAAKRSAAEGHCRVDVGFLGGIVPGNQAELRSLCDAGVLGFKAFLAPSGVEEFAAVSLDALASAIQPFENSNVPIMVHAELPELLRSPEGDPQAYHTWLDSRPAEAEARAVANLAELADRFNARVHVVHVSAPESVAIIEQARNYGLAFSGETCPHYLGFCAEEIPDGAIEYKCAPPIRDRASRDGLWHGLLRGVLRMIVTDHSPAPPDIKQPVAGDFTAAWGGIASLQLRLPAVWTLARARGFPPDALVEWLCRAPALVAGLRRKGRLAAGCDADLVIWHPEREFRVTAEMLRHRHSMTPWMGHRLAGEVEATYLRGQRIFDPAGPVGPPSGRLLSRTGS
jgi:allantoinase